jgi:hypothetical protein
MKIKVFSAMSESTLERKVNTFISGQNIKVMQIQFQASFGSIYAMITYAEQEGKSNVDAFANI